MPTSRAAAVTAKRSRSRPRKLLSICRKVNSLPYRQLLHISSGRAWSRVPEQPRQHAFAGAEHFVDFLGLLAAGFSEIGPAAAAAADDWRDFLHDLTRFDTGGQVRRDSHDDLHFPVAGRRQDDDAALDPGLQRVGEPAQGIFVETLYLATRELHARDLDGIGVLRRAATAHRKLGLQLGDLAPEALGL